MKPNIILIVIDAVRQDVLALYGGSVKTPELEKFAEDSVAYKNAITVNASSLSSHASLFTGMYPSEHKVIEQGRILNSEDEILDRLERQYHDFSGELIPTMLRKEGYHTYGISNNIFVSNFVGFNKGFDWFCFLPTLPKYINDEYREAWKLGSSISQIAKELIRQGRIGDIPKFKKLKEKVDNYRNAVGYPVDKGAGMMNNIVMNSHFEQPFFLFLNYMEAHNPYKNEKHVEIDDQYYGVKKLNKERVEQLRKDYEEEIAYLDKKLGEIIDSLKLNGLYDNSLIIILGDHGQAFNEHEHMYHGIYLYNELIRIPLIIKYPNSKRYTLKNGYQSITSIKALIKDIVNGGDDGVLTTPNAFAESFGTDEVVPPAYQRYKETLTTKYNKRRRAIYQNNKKIIYNETDGKVEEGNELNKEQIEELINTIKSRFSRYN